MKVNVDYVQLRANSGNEEVVHLLVRNGPDKSASEVFRYTPKVPRRRARGFYIFVDFHCRRKIRPRAG
jgi:hypothetical protein